MQRGAAVNDDLTSLTSERTHVLIEAMSEIQSLVVAGLRVPVPAPSSHNVMLIDTWCLQVFWTRLSCWG